MLETINLEDDITTSNKKLIYRLDIMDDYCDRFVTSMPITIPIRKNSSSTITTVGSYKTSTSVGSGDRITNNIYRYINYSIDNLKKYTLG